MSKTRETKIETKKITVLKKFFTEQGTVRHDIGDEVELPVNEDLDILLKYGYIRLMEEK